MFCPNCGTDVTDMKFCPNCGKPINFTSEEDTIHEKTIANRLQVNQLNVITYGVIIGLWGMLLIAGSLVPYLLSEIFYDYSQYNSYSATSIIILLLFSAVFCIRGLIDFKNDGYTTTPHYIFAKNIAINRSCYLQMILLLVFIMFAMFSKRTFTNGTLWKMSVVAVLAEFCWWGFWIYKIKRFSIDDKKMVLAAVLNSIKEFMISFLIFYAIDLVLMLLTDISAIISVICILLIFLYPALNYRKTKKVLRNKYHIK